MAPIAIATETSLDSLTDASPSPTTSGTGGNYAYTTLITRASYLAGVVVLAHTLRTHGSQYPLIVFYPPTLGAPALRALELEAPKSNLILRSCEFLLPPENVKTWLIAERFMDTWTKLRVFESFDYDAVCYLDADMAIFNRNMDVVFSRAADLPKDGIAANHACVCNKERDPWAPDSWREENCAYTPLSHPKALSHPTAVTADARPTYHLLNSGMFLYRPTRALWEEMLHFFNTTDKLPTFKFPDQDFLAEFFKGRWRSLGWQFNALKTMRYWHPDMWRDDEVVCLHYIVDKPWASRVGEDGRAGYRGNDAETHSWWWDAYESWVDARQRSESGEVLELVGRYVAKPKGEESDGPQDADMLAIGAGVQALASTAAPNEPRVDVSGGKKENRLPPPGEPVTKAKAFGEKGHGPVVKPKRGLGGSSRIIP